MIRRIKLLVPVLVVSAALVAGCGGGGKKATSSSSNSRSTAAANTSQSSTSSSAATTSSSTSSSAATTSSSTSTSSAATTSSSTSTKGGGLANLGALGSPAAAAAICQSSLASSLHLTGDQKDQLQGYCKAIATAKPGELKAAEKRLCEAVIKDVVPASEQAAASAACKKL